MLAPGPYNPSMSHEEHRAASPARVRCAVITVSDTRTPDTDASGRAIAELLEAAGHAVSFRQIVRDEPAQIRDALTTALASGDVDVAVTTGGTGIARRDTTIEVVTALLDKRIDGFGELFRMLSYDEVGPAAMLSRACAGLAGRTVVVALPGSEAAVRLAVTRLLLPEIGHLVREANR
jgi:molybdopterin adenylyltransferase